MVSRTYTSQEIEDLERREEVDYEENADFYRSRFTIEERMALCPKSLKRTEKEEEITRRILDELHLERENDPEYQKKYSQAIERVLRYSQRNALKEIFQGKSELYPELRCVKITREAYDKANQTAKRVVEVSKSSNEIYFHLLNDTTKLGDNIIRDIYIPNQKVSPSGCKTNQDLAETDRDLIRESGKKIVGWSHSHGHHPTFHSNTDYNLLEEIPFTDGVKKTVTVKPPWAISGGEIDVDVYVCPSIVVNARDSEPSIAISFEYLEPGTNSIKTHILEKSNSTKNGEFKNSRNTTIYYTDKINFEIIDEQNNIITNMNEIDKEIYEKVNSHSGFKRDFVNYMKNKQNFKAPQNIQKTISTNETLENISLESASPIEISENLNEKDENQQYTLTVKEYAEIIKEIKLLRIRNEGLEKRIEKIEKASRKRIS